MTDSVWVLVIEHRHGDNLTVHSSEESARKSLMEYVDYEGGLLADDVWEQVFAGIDPEKDPQSYINAYFDNQDDEFYSLNAHNVED